MHEIAADHAFGETLLVFLVDHPAAGGKVRLAASIEVAKRNLFFAAPTQGVARTNDRSRLRHSGGAAVLAFHGIVHR
jgi:hypothetical protein